MKCHAHTVYACVFRVTAVSESVFPFSIKCQYREGITCPVSVFPILRSFIKTAGGVKTRCLGSGVKFKGRGKKCRLTVILNQTQPFPVPGLTSLHARHIRPWNLHLEIARLYGSGSGVAGILQPLLDYIFGVIVSSSTFMGKICRKYLPHSFLLVKQTLVGDFPGFFSCWDSEVLRFLYADWFECTHLKALKRNCVGFSG